MTLMPVVGYEGEYSVAEDGQVWSHKSDMFMEPKSTPRGGVKVTLFANSRHKTWQVARLVAVAFGAAKEADEAVWHIDGDVMNDHYTNLRGGTRKELEAHKRRLGVSHTGRLANRTHCKRGHEFTVQNTYREGGEGGKRQCRTCNADLRRQYRRNRKIKEKEK